MGFFDDFTGKSAREDLKKGAKASNAALDQGYAGLQQNYNQAYDLYSPYAQSGQAGNAMYSNAIGLNGHDAQQQVVNQFAGSDPFRQFNEDNSNRATARQWNANGAYDSGASRLASARVNQERGSQDWNAMLDRWGNMGQQGFQATGAQAGIKTGLGDSAWGYGTTKAGQATNQANAMAQSRGILTNNLLQVAGTAAKFMKPSPV